MLEPKKIEWTKQDWEDLRQKVAYNCVSEICENYKTAQEIIDES